MGRCRWGMIVLVHAALAASGWAAEPTTGPRSSLLARYLGLDSKSRVSAVATSPVNPIVISTLPPEVQAEALRAEQEAYLRRVAVCTELRRVALERNDPALYEQADALEQQAEQLYRLRVQRLGIPIPTSNGDGTKPSSSLANSPSGAARAVREAARPLLPPAPPVPVTAEARVREVKP